MAIFRCSMFGHIVYDDKLTYQELLDTEARVTALMQNALEECGAQHIDFAPEADALLMECLFSDMDRAAHRVLCDTVIRQLGPGVLARFLFVDRRMEEITFYGPGQVAGTGLQLSHPARSAVGPGRASGTQPHPPSPPPRPRRLRGNHERRDRKRPESSAAAGRRKKARLRSKTPFKPQMCRKNAPAVTAVRPDSLVRGGVFMPRRHGRRLSSGCAVDMGKGLPGWRNWQTQGT